MKMKQFYQKMAALVLASVVFLYAGVGMAEERQPLRVGINTLPSLKSPIDGSRDQNQDYMRLLANYAGMQAVFVSDSWTNNLAKLASGEIDTIANITDLPYRHAFFDYGRIPMSLSTSMLYLRGGVATFDNPDRTRPLNIGIIRGQYTSPRLGPVLNYEGFSYTTQEFEDRKHILAAYDAGQIDGCSLDTQLPEDLLPAAALDTDPVYFVVRKGNTELLDRLNQAAARLATTRPMMFADLYDLYHSDGAGAPLLLDRRERDYLLAHPTLRIAVVISEQPYAYLDENGEFAGGLRAVTDRIGADLGIDIEIVPVHSAEEAYADLADGTADVLLNSRWSPGWAGEHGYMQTAPFTTSYFTEVTRRGGRPARPRIAYWSQRLADALIVPRYGSDKLVRCGSAEECLRAVEENEADVAFLRQEVAQYQTIAGRFPGLVASGTVAFSSRSAIAIPQEADTVLLSILDKEIAHMGQDVAGVAVAEEQQKLFNNRTLSSYFFNYPQYFLLGMLIIFLLCGAAFYRYRRMKKKNAAHLQSIIDSDLDTGLRNLAWLEREGAQRVESMPKGAPLAAVVIRAMRPDVIVGTYGRDALAELCKRLAGAFEGSSWTHLLATRAGASEVFLLACAEEKSLVPALTLILRQNESQQVGRMLVRIPLEAGVCYLGDPRMDLKTAVNNAELAAHEAGPVTVFSSALQRETLLVSRMESLQEQALAAREFHIWYQPKYDLKTRKCIGAEALVRWESKELGFLPPGKFIPLFESNGFITQLDFYNLEHVMEFQREAKRKGLPVLPISVNQSRQHMREEGYIQHVQELVDIYSPDGIELELTETAFDVLGEALRTHSLDIVQRLHGMGFSIDMDDFGSGYSDLSLLNQLPLDVMKIDRSMLLASEGSERMQTVLRQMIELGHALGMKVICEGIETEEQEQLLIACGCEYGQGFLYGKPMRRADYEAFLKEHA
ncbi:EAL domain-containing protein [uncultured Selenomonas sp.]|uniref:EAL domain-containing protein n=1 Tax=uncultured Selenomonas sp. TaxID=159275 RepID=UPI0025F35AE4|nr:EAL domain-containing protein [uncultured Selenomonas sp.]